MSTTTTLTTSPATLAPEKLHLSTPLQSPPLSLDAYTKFDVTTIIGTEFPLGSLQLADLLHAPNADALLRDLALLVSTRGVAFFRAQHLGIGDQKLLGLKLGEFSGRPDADGLHCPPRPVISSKEVFAFTEDPAERSRFASALWHIDTSFLKVPSAYGVLKIHSPPATGGDTLWASAYEAYDRLSPAYQTFLHGLTATHTGRGFAGAWKDRHGVILHDPPQNPDQSATAVHPVIRTNPLTGWNGIFVNRAFTSRINELSKDESDAVLKYLFRLISDNHDLQVRFKWGQYENGAADIAIWDNRCTVHTPTDDYFDTDGVRLGDRVITRGEKPYFDVAGKGRRGELGWGDFGERKA